MIISLSGVDGSGKSTLAHKLVEHYNNHKQPARYYYLGNYFLLSPLVALLHFFHTGSHTKKNPFLTTSKKNIGMQLWLFFSLIDNALNFLRLRLNSQRGYLVICDRYFYDKLIGFQYHGYANRVFSFIYRKLTPHPDLAFFLDLDEETSRQREVSGPHSLSFYRKIRRGYRRLSQSVRCSRIDVGSKTKNQIFKELLRTINQC